MVGLGSVTIVFSILGCCGMALHNKTRSIVFFATNVGVVLIEIILGIYWLLYNKQYMNFPQVLNWFLAEDFETEDIWINLQIKVNGNPEYSPMFNHLLILPVQLLWDS